MKTLIFCAATVLLIFSSSAIASLRCDRSDGMDIIFRRDNLLKSLMSNNFKFTANSPKDIEALEELISFLEECKRQLDSVGKSNQTETIPKLKEVLAKAKENEAATKDCPNFYQCKQEINDNRFIRYWVSDKKYELKVSPDDTPTLLQKKERFKHVETFFNTCACVVNLLQITDQFNESKKARIEIDKLTADEDAKRALQKAEDDKEALAMQKEADELEKQRELIKKLSNTPACLKTIALVDYCRDVESIDGVKEAQKYEAEIARRSGVPDDDKKRTFAQSKMIIEASLIKHAKEYDHFKGSVPGLNSCKTIRDENGSANHHLTDEATKAIQSALKKNCGTSQYLP